MTQDTMKLLVLIILPYVLGRSHNDCPSVTFDDVQQHFCKADVVFVGKRVRGTSSVYMGNVTVTTVFEIKRSFKGNESIGDEVNIFRSYIKDSKCDRNPFPGFERHFLIFAVLKDVSVTIREIEACNFSPRWKCVPEELKDHLKKDTFVCNN